MNDEIKEILSYLKIENGTIGSELSYEETHLLFNYITNLQQENERLKEQINQYENPDDLTLFYMWLDEKAKDKMKHLQQENETLHENNQDMQEEMARVWEENERLKELQQENERLKFQLENQQIISSKYRMRRNIYKSRCEKAIEYINNTIEDKPLTDFDCGSNNACNDLLNILQNGSDSQ